MFTAEKPEHEFYMTLTLLTEFVIPAAQSSTPLPPNVAGETLVQSHLDAPAEHEL